MKKRKNAKINIFGYVLFFVTIASIVGISIMAFDFVNRKSNGNNTIIAITILLCILLSATICTLIDFIRRKVMIEKPVNKILDATSKVTAGDFTVRLEPIHEIDKYDEFDIIMEDLNKMTSELSKMEILRNDFVSNVSHEIKTPLAIIQNYATAMKVDGLDDETRDKYADALITAAKKINDLVTNILRLNKLENQELNPEVEKIDLGEMLREAIIRYEDFIEKKQLQIDCDIDDFSINSSASYLEIVWNNLLSNAIKFTECGGVIKISLKEVGPYKTVKISDSGCGISNDIGEHIFDKFYQGDLSHSQEGNGLGLALVKKVIDLLGGEIIVESVVGEGTTFIVKIRDYNYEEL